jgi:type IV secretion system protein VirD4
MNELCRVADRECRDNCLPVPVRFILDDFATNCKIEEFPRMIASIRSRGISTMLMIQAESQLQESYGYDGRTVIGNCDTYVYLGGNDVETAKAVAERCDVPVKKILYMPVGTNWIFRRGQAPVNARNFDLDMLLREKDLVQRSAYQR